MLAMSRLLSSFLPSEMTTKYVKHTFAYFIPSQGRYVEFPIYVRERDIPCMIEATFGKEYNGFDIEIHGARCYEMTAEIDDQYKKA